MISSTQNPQIQTLRRLLSDTAYRKETGYCVLETQRSLQDTLHARPDLIHHVYYHTLPSDTLKVLTDHRIPSTEVSERVLSGISRLKTQPGVMAICHSPLASYESVFSSLQVAFYLDGVSNPSNMGAIIRNAAAFGIDAVLLSPDCCDPFHPESLRAMAGHFYQIPVLECPLATFLEAFPTAQLNLLDSAATRPISELNLTFPCLFFFGAETGIRSIPQNHSLTRYIIPMAEGVDSLNVSVSSGIMGYLIQSQRLKRS